MGIARSSSQRAEAIGDLPPIISGKFHYPLLKARVEINFHSVPVNGLDRPEARAFCTSEFTVL